VFHPGVPQFAAQHFPKALERTNTTPPTMWGAFYGPLLVAAGAVAGHRGARLTGACLSAGYTAAMADIGSRGVVPGANDNLSAVAALLSLAHSLADEPVPGVRVMLVFVGSEESFMEGMQAFGRRHFPSLPKESTTVIVLDTVGSPHLSLLEGEGMLYIRDYSERLKALIRGCADELGIWLYPNLRFRNATDALIALNAGYEVAMLGSVTDQKAPANYHWPTDTAENVDYERVEDAARLSRAALERISAPFAASAIPQATR
jgi:Zn-dependent M28 family amino/carboxypeptidase